MVWSISTNDRKPFRILLSYLFVGPLCYTEQEEEEPYKANTHQEAEGYHGDYQGIRFRASPQSNREHLVGWKRGELIQVTVLDQPEEGDHG